MTIEAMQHLAALSSHVHLVLQTTLIMTPDQHRGQHCCELLGHESISVFPLSTRLSNHPPALQASLMLLPGEQ